MDAYNKDKWIDDVLESTDGSRKAIPVDALFYRIEKGLRTPFVKGSVIPLRAVSVVAASVLLLIAANVYVAIRMADRDNNSNAKLQDVVRYYDITNDKEIGGGI